MPHSQQVLRKLMRLNEDFVRSHDNKREVFARMLDFILEVTGSQYGFVAEVLYRDGAPYLKTYAITNIAWNEETRALYEKYARQGMEFTNLDTLFGHTLRTGELVIANDPANDPRRGGLPGGHPPLRHYLGIPVKDSSDHQIGMLGLANKPGGYGEADVDLLQPFLSTSAVMMVAMQVESQNALMQEAQRHKDLFIANVSHEIRTPLSAIVGFNDLLRDTELDDDQRKYVETIAIASRSLGVLINDLLDLSKVQSGSLVLERKPFSIEHVVRDVVQLHTTRARQNGIKLLLRFDQDIPPHVIGDETRLSQILMNLVSNAVKFTPAGSVEVHVDEVRRGESDTVVRFTVRDTGIGVAPEKAEMIFERFAQAESSTTRVYGGTGLGLSIVRSLAELHGGTVRLRSELGKGSEFTVEIPYPIAAAGPVREPAEFASSRQQRVLEGMKVLLVEDNEHNQFLAETYLKRNGAVVTAANNGQVALDLLRRERFEAIMMDIQMPVMDGSRTTVMIRRDLHLDVPIIGCSAHAMESERQECLASGMNDYITKPYDEQKIVRTLAQYRHKPVGAGAPSASGSGAAGRATS